MFDVFARVNIYLFWFVNAEMYAHRHKDKLVKAKRRNQHRKVSVPSFPSERTRCFSKCINNKCLELNTCILHFSIKRNLLFITWKCISTPEHSHTPNVYVDVCVQNQNMRLWAVKCICMCCIYYFALHSLGSQQLLQLAIFKCFVTYKMGIHNWNSRVQSQ